MIRECPSCGNPVRRLFAPPRLRVPREQLGREAEDACEGQMVSWHAPGQGFPGPGPFEVIVVEDDDLLIRPYDAPSEPVCIGCWAGCVWPALHPYLDSVPRYLHLRGWPRKEMLAMLDRENIRTVILATTGIHPSAEQIDYAYTTIRALADVEQANLRAHLHQAQRDAAALRRAALDLATERRRPPRPFVGQQARQVEALLSAEQALFRLVDVPAPGATLLDELIAAKRLAAVVERLVTGSTAGYYELVQALVAYRAASGRPPEIGTQSE